MEKQILQVGDLAIATYHSQGNGPTALLVHGNSASSLTFQRQLDGELGQQFRLVALDLPGHGASARASNPATYSMPGYAAIVVEVARQLNMTEGAFIGWSLGGHIVLEAAAALPKASGLLIYGTPPIGKPPAMDKAFLPNPAMAAAFAPELSADEITGFGLACLKPGLEVPAEFYDDMQRTDGQARSMMAASIGDGRYADEVEIVANLNLPLAILHGEHEQLVSLAYIESLKIPTLWRGAVQIITDSGHSPQLEQPEQFNILLKAFLRDTSNL